MADTQTLLALIDEFPQPFLDPEATPAPEPVVEEVVAEEVVTSWLEEAKIEITWRDSINAALSEIEGHSDLQGLAIALMVDIASIGKLRESATQQPAGTQQPLPSVWDDALTEFELPNLPETHARQGSGDCPSGMCPIDH